MGAAAASKALVFGAAVAVARSASVCLRLSETEKLKNDQWGFYKVVSDLEACPTDEVDGLQVLERKVYDAWIQPSITDLEDLAIEFAAAGIKTADAAVVLRLAASGGCSGTSDSSPDDVELRLFDETDAASTQTWGWWGGHDDDDDDDHDDHDNGWWGDDDDDDDGNNNNDNDDDDGYWWDQDKDGANGNNPAGPLALQPRRVPRGSTEQRLRTTRFSATPGEYNVCLREERNGELQDTELKLRIPDERIDSISFAPVPGVRGRLMVRGFGFRRGTQLRLVPENADCEARDAEALDLSVASVRRENKNYARAVTTAFEPTEGIFRLCKAEGSRSRLRDTGISVDFPNKGATSLKYEMLPRGTSVRVVLRGSGMGSRTRVNLVLPGASCESEDQVAHSLSISRSWLECDKSTERCEQVAETEQFDHETSGSLRVCARLGSGGENGFRDVGRDVVFVDPRLLWAGVGYSRDLGSPSSRADGSAGRSSTQLVVLGSGLDPGYTRFKLVREQDTCDDSGVSMEVEGTEATTARSPRELQDRLRDAMDGSSVAQDSSFGQNELLQVGSARFQLGSLRAGEAYRVCVRYSSRDDYEDSGLPLLEPFRIFRAEVSGAQSRSGYARVRVVGTGIDYGTDWGLAESAAACEEGNSGGPGVRTDALEGMTPRERVDVDENAYFARIAVSDTVLLGDSLRRTRLCVRFSGTNEFRDAGVNLEIQEARLLVHERFPQTGMRDRSSFIGEGLSPSRDMRVHFVAAGRSCSSEPDIAVNVRDVTQFADRDTRQPMFRVTTDLYTPRAGKFRVCLSDARGDSVDTGLDHVFAEPGTLAFSKTRRRAVLQDPEQFVFKFWGTGFEEDTRFKFQPLDAACSDTDLDAVPVTKSPGVPRSGTYMNRRNQTMALEWVSSDQVGVRAAGMYKLCTRLSSSSEWLGPKYTMAAVPPGEDDLRFDVETGRYKLCSGSGTVVRTFEAGSTSKCQSDPGDPNTGENEGLSDAAIAGIAGGVGGAVLLAGVAVFVRRRRNKDDSRLAKRGSRVEVMA